MVKFVRSSAVQRASEKQLTLTYKNAKSALYDIAKLHRRPVIVRKSRSLERERKTTSFTVTMKRYSCISQTLAIHHTHCLEKSCYADINAQFARLRGRLGVRNVPQASFFNRQWWRWEDLSAWFVFNPICPRLYLHFSPQSLWALGHWLHQMGRV